MTVIALMPRTRAVSRPPLPLRLNSLTRCLPWGSGLGGGIKQAGLVEAGRIEAAVALLTGGRLAAFAHGLALTVETAL